NTKARKKHSRFKQVLFSHLSGVKGSLTTAALCTVVLALTDLVKPWPLKIIFDNVLLNKPLPDYLSSLKGMIEGDKTVAILAVSSSIILVSLLKSFSGYFQLSTTSRVGFRLAHSLRRELFLHLQRLSLSFHRRAETGELLTKVTNDTNDLREVFTEFGLAFVSEMLSLVGMFAVMLVLNWRLSLIVLATFPVLLFLSFYRYRTIRDSAKRQRKAEGKIASRVGEVLSSILVVQAFARENYEGQRFDAQSARTLDESIRTAKMEAAAARSIDIVTATGLCAVVLFGSLEALNGQLTPGNVYIFASYMNSLYGPIRNLAKISAKFSKTMVSAERIAEVLDLEPEIEDRPGAVEAADLKGEMIFDRVSFAYNDGPQVLTDVSFKIAPGQCVALLGASGSGKSTISALISRFYDPQRGAVLIDGVNVKDYQRESLRSQIGIILQDSILFGASVRENIAYGKLDASDQEIITAATKANAHDFIMSLENGYDTIIGERGGTLSGGQRQRIAIARTFIRDVPILILDEPMTGLDVESEAAVKDALRRLVADKTCLLITHDLQAALEADLILVLEDGQIVEEGKPHDLLAGSQRYRGLYDLKFSQYGNRNTPAEV
ncbi:MAG TPA: ABC transporter ATP-binding protein, partial [Blastocatellia bacterium]|nr:ABC transporter ATP-binding protein [Blastocatellia bacterium]